MKHIYLLFSAILFLLISHNVYSQTDEEVTFYIDSISRLPEDTNKVDAYNDLIWQIKYFDSTNSVFCAEKSIELATKLEYWKGVGTAQKNLAAYYYYSANYPEALELYEKSLTNFEKAEYEKGIAISYKNIGNTYSQVGSWQTALSYYFKSLKLRDKIGDTIGKATTLNSIGVLYSSVKGNEDSALVYFERALKIFIEVEDYYNIAYAYLSFSTVYFNLSSERKDIQKDSIYYSQIDSSIYYSKKCTEVSSKIGILRLEAAAYETTGSCYLDIEENDSAFSYISKSLEIRKLDKNTYGIVSSLSILGKYYLEIKDYKNAKKTLKEALELSRKIQTDQVTQNILANFASLYYQTGEYQLAFDNYDEYIKIKDSLTNEKNTRKLTQISMQYNFDKKQELQELEQQKKDAVKEAQIKRQKMITGFFLLGFLLMLGLAFVIFRSYKQKQKTNKILSDKNNQINIKNAQLNQSNEEIEAQRDEIERQKEFVEKQNKDITSSINYARRIQRALLTPFGFFETNFEDYFVLYKPRDIVSGDYFWASKVGNKLIVTAADCTGHGVPGAFMSMLGISFLNQIVNQKFKNHPEKINAGDILDRMRKQVVLTLGGQADDEDSPQEGMDMALVVIDTDKKTINFAGAYNPLFVVRNNELNIIKADRMPVGYHFIRMAQNFKNNEISYQKGDKIYMFSDGYQDQFGGENGRKFSPKALREIIIRNNQLPMFEQKDILNKEFEDWRQTGKEFRQLDDVLIIGISL